MRKIILLLLIALFLFAGRSFAGIDGVWHHVSLEDIAENTLEQTAKRIWRIFEVAAKDRGFVIKPNYKPFEPNVQTIVRLDTPLGELAHNGCILTVRSDSDGKVERVVFSRSSKTEESTSTQKNLVGYSRGRLGEELTFWVSEKIAAADQLSAWKTMRLDMLKGPSVAVEDAQYFFPEIADMRLRFINLFPQDRFPFQKIIFAPGRIVFGSILDTDVFISYWKSAASGQMIGGEISWKITFGEFLTGEEIGLAESFFYFMQENLSKAKLITPAKMPF